MKLSILCLLTAFVLVGCSSELRCLNSVKNEFRYDKNVEISTIPGIRWKFLVRTSSGEIWYVETLNGNDDEVTDKVRIFNGKQ